MDKRGGDLQVVDRGNLECVKKKSDRVCTLRTRREAVGLSIGCEMKWSGNLGGPKEWQTRGGRRNWYKGEGGAVVYKGGKRFSCRRVRMRERRKNEGQGSGGE